MKENICGRTDEKLKKTISEIRKMSSITAKQLKKTLKELNRMKSRYDILTRKYKKVNDDYEELKKRLEHEQD